MFRLPPTPNALLRAATFAVGLTLAGSGASCGQSDLLSPEQAALLVDVLELVQDAPETTAFQGTRRIEWFDGAPAGLRAEHVESVKSDGLGGFSIDVEEVVFSGSHSVEEYVLLESLRAGWSWRHRDFRIQDVEAVLQNYAILAFGEATTVAGRACQHLEVAIAWDPISVQHAIDVDVPEYRISK